MPDEFMGQNAAHVPQRERVARVLQNAPVSRPQDVFEVLALIGPDASDVRVEPRFPAAVAEAACELDQRLGRVDGLAAGDLANAPLDPRLAAHGLEVGAHPVEVERRPSYEEDLGLGLVQLGTVCRPGGLDPVHLDHGPDPKPGRGRRFR